MAMKLYAGGLTTLPSSDLLTGDLTLSTNTIYWVDSTTVYEAGNGSKDRPFSSLVAAKAYMVAHGAPSHCTILLAPTHEETITSVLQFEYNTNIIGLGRSGSTPSASVTLTGDGQLDFWYDYGTTDHTNRSSLRNVILNVGNTTGGGYGTAVRLGTYYATIRDCVVNVDNAFSGTVFSGVSLAANIQDVLISRSNGESTDYAEAFALATAGIYDNTMCWMRNVTLSGRLEFGACDGFEVEHVSLLNGAKFDAVSINTDNGTFISDYNSDPGSNY